jgi:hypothetical protein
MTWKPFSSIKTIPGGFYYLASPYAKYFDGPERAAVEAARIAAQVMLRGVPVYSPIAHNHMVSLYLPEIDKADHDFWMPLDKVFVDQSCGLLVAGLAGWRESKGVGMEIDWFLATNKPRYLLHPHTMELNILPWPI